MATVGNIFSATVTGIIFSVASYAESCHKGHMQDGRVKSTLNLLYCKIQRPQFLRAAYEKFLSPPPHASVNLKTQLTGN